MKSDEVLSNAVEINSERLHGIYYLIKDGVIVYVGQSINVYARIGAHIAAYEKDFDSYAFVSVPIEDMNRIETEEILNHRPKYNGELPQNDEYKSIAQLKRFFHVGANHLKKIIRNKGITPIVYGGNVVYKLSDFLREE